MDARLSWAERSGRLKLLAGVGLGDNVADAGLVEALVAVVALEVFEVRAQGALGAELLGLLRGDLAALEDGLDAFVGDGPALALGERLPLVREGGEGVHGLHRFDRELVFERVPVELALEVMHAGLEERLTVKGAPETDGAELGPFREGRVGEIAADLFGRHVYIGEDGDA